MRHDSTAQSGAHSGFSSLRPHIARGLAALMLLVSSLLLISAVSTAQQPARGAEVPLQDEALEARARTIMQEIRCLVCQNQSIVDSDADLARDLREIVREQVSAGKDKAEIEAYLVARYGDWVLLRPPFKGITILLWGSPVVLLLLGGVIVYLRLSASSETVAASPAPLSAEEAALLVDLLAGDKSPMGENTGGKSTLEADADPATDPQLGPSPDQKTDQKSDFKTNSEAAP